MAKNNSKKFSTKPTDIKTWKHDGQRLENRGIANWQVANLQLLDYPFHEKVVTAVIGNNQGVGNWTEIEWST